MKAKTKVHYVASTHWDREWYLPFQGFRYRLVKLAAQLLDILDSREDYKQFVFDGQTAVLDDIVEARPDLRARLERHIKSGRLHVGPWYTMPDERIVSGESLIRNMLLGFKTSRSYGAGPMRYGYICDIFGHIAQTPQIFAGMGIGHALLGRGTNHHSHPPFFEWESPDGSRVAAFRLPDIEGYGIGTKLHNAAEAENPASKEWREGVAMAARELYESERKRGAKDVQLWLDGIDHIFPSRNIPEALKAAAKELSGECEIVFSSLPEFASDVDSLVKKAPVSKGELVKTSKLASDGYLWLISHCLSSHYPMKRLNDICQDSLEKWTEPYWVFANLEGRAPSKGFLDVAWKELLRNHAHDTICGCSVDQVHKDSECRYDQVLGICRNILDDILSGSIKTERAQDEKLISLAVFNALPFAHRRIVEAEIPWPEGMRRRQLQGFSDDNIPSFIVEDGRGRPVPFQLVSYKGAVASRHISDSKFNAGMHEPVKLLLDAEFEGIGPKIFKVRESSVPVRNMESLLSGPLSAENEFLSLSINQDGSFDIREKVSGVEFKSLLSFEDCGEIGDGWFHVEPVTDEVFSSKGCHADISIIEKGPLRVAFRVSRTMRLPEEMDMRLFKRAGRKCEVGVVSEIALEKGARHVSCAVAVDNCVKNHRMRALFETGVRGDSYFASQPFAFVERKRGIDASTSSWKECDVEERSFCGVAGVSNGKKGLALIAGHGLHEIAVRDDKPGTMALTLFRSFRKTVSTAGQERGQLQGCLEFKFGLAPFAGSPDLLSLERLSHTMNSGVEHYSCKGYEMASMEPFMRLERGDALLSALKPAEDGDGVVVRLYNPCEGRLKDAVLFDRPFVSATECSHDERPFGKPVAEDAKSFALWLAPFQIRSFLVRFK